MKSDIEIARDIRLKNIEDIAAKAGMPTEELEHYGRYIAKVPLHLIDEQKVQQNHLILVTAISPTKAGIGKTTVSVGLSIALNRIGKRSILALREPSLGPCFGMKGGAAGGGYSQVLPMEKINLHFTGDFHAITTAHNMITAMLDNYIFRHQGQPDTLKTVFWKRVVDISDRSLRHIVTGIGAGNGVVSESGFDITPASEIMAILCLATDQADLHRRIENILLGITSEGKNFYVKDLGIAGSIVVLLLEAINPNLVQTTEHTPAFIHGGPFANIAHGCNSIVATKMAMTFSDYAVTEAGFGADLGAEKFFDIKCRKAGIYPKLTVLVATTKGLKLHGDMPDNADAEQQLQAMRRGLANMDKHVQNLQAAGQTVVVTLNKYATDTDDEIALLSQHCKEMEIGFAVNEAFAKGGEGCEQLAHLCVERITAQPSRPLNYAYHLEDGIHTKVEKIAKNIYGAARVEFSAKATTALAKLREWGMEQLPVCIAKTQYSFSDDAKRTGTPSGFTFTVHDLVLNAGAEMVVAIAGDVMRMPGLPAHPQAEKIDLIEGHIVGLA